LNPTTPLDARLGGALLACVFLLPLLAYAIAAASHVIARLFGGRGSGLGARLALFWALLAIAPAMLLQGLVAGFVGPGAALNLVYILVALGFLRLWFLMLAEVERDAA